MAKKKELLTQRPQAPEYFSDIARDHWADLFGSLIDMRLATNLDKPAIEMACTQYEQFRTAENDKDRQAAIASYLRIMSKYGGTPKDRVMMKYTPSNPKKKTKSDKDLEEDLGL